MPSSGQYSRTLWVSIDPSVVSGDGQVSPSNQAASQYTLVAEAVLPRPTVTSAPGGRRGGGHLAGDGHLGQNPGTDVYTGHVKAVGNGATLTQLVYDITGDTGDLPQLLAANTNVAYNPSTTAVDAGTVIDISPLLNVLETTLRNNVVAAANAPAKYNNAGFGLANWPTSMNESWINGLFGVALPSP